MSPKSNESILLLTTESSVIPQLILRNLLGSGRRIRLTRKLSLYIFSLLSQARYRIAVFSLRTAWLAI